MKTKMLEADRMKGPALDWATAKATGAGAVELHKDNHSYWLTDHHYSPSTHWCAGGPLIEKYGISIKMCWNVNGKDQSEGPSEWRASMNPAVPGERRFGLQCESPLVAACREIVIQHLGFWVEVPIELVGDQS